MAETSNIKYSRFLFTKEGGSSIIFRMTPCPEKSRLRPLVEAGGGQFMQGVTPGAIGLISPTDVAKSSDLISSSYIDDCIKENKLLDINNYSVLKGSMYMSRLDPNRNMLRMQSRGKSGRNTYRYSEDVSIIQYLLEADRYKQVNGDKIWQQMESLKIGNHTWQSLKDHFRKIILPNIGTYGFPPEEVAKFQKDDKPVKGSLGRKRAAKFSLEYAATGKDVEEEEKGTEENDFSAEECVFTDEDVDEFDQNLVQVAKASGRTLCNENAETADERKLGKNSASGKGDEHDVLSSSAQLADKAKRKTGKGLRSPKKHCLAVDDCDQEQSTSVGQERITVSDSAAKSRAVERLEAQGNEHMQEIQNVEGGYRHRSAKCSNSPEMRTRYCKAIETSVTEIAVADSQNDPPFVDQEDEVSDFCPRKKKRNRIGSSSERETDAESEIFPVVYSGRRYGRGQKEKEMALPELVEVASSTTANTKCSSPQPGTSKQILPEVSKKPQKSFVHSGLLRDFIFSETIREDVPETVSGAWPTDTDSQLADKQLTEKILATCDKLMDWLDLSAEMFAQATYQCNGSVDNAIKWLFDGSGRTWDPSDDSDLISGCKAKLKVLQDKYGEEFITERRNFLTENLDFL